MKAEIITEIIRLYDRIKELELKNDYLETKCKVLEGAAAPEQIVNVKQEKLAKYGVETLWEKTSRSYRFCDVLNNDNKVIPFNRWFNNCTDSDNIPSWLSVDEWKELILTLAEKEYKERLDGRNVETDGEE